MIKVSVIIPVYNVEDYIERCLHSLFLQTMEDIQFIFVDDGCTDLSILKIKEILKFYPNREKNVKIIRHSINRGVAEARKTGMKEALGEYIIHCDPDDYVDKDIYEKLYNRAIQTGSDVVTCFHYLNEVPIIYKYSKSPQSSLKNMYRKKAQYVHLYTKLVKSKIIKDHDIYPISDINFEEDLNTSIRILHYCKSISVVTEPLYHYCLRNNSLSTSLFQKFDPVRLTSLETNLTILKELGKGKYRIFENYLIYRIKFIYPEIFQNEKIWFDWKKECHRDILRFDNEPWLNRIILWIAMSNFRIFKIAKKLIPSLNYVKV